jgi:hypothetical protein
MRKKHVFVLLQGGLGNQLFQYSFAKSLSVNPYFEVTLDLSALQEDVHLDKTSVRQFSLDRQLFPVSEKNVLSSEELRNLRIWNSLRTKPWNFLRKGYIKVLRTKLIQMAQGTTVISEREWNRGHVARSVYRNIVLDGFWQKLAFPLSIESSIRTELRERTRCCKSVSSIETRVSSQAALAVHIRRGDYVSNPDALNFHGLLSADYFNDAIREVTSTHPVEVIYVFSDDTAWCKENLTFDSRLVFVADTFRNICDLDELAIMSACRFFVISNSTFSWWGAWLSNVNGKNVIAPAKWFADESANLKTVNLVPDSWNRRPSKFHRGVGI